MFSRRVYNLKYDMISLHNCRYIRALLDVLRRMLPSVVCKVTIATLITLRI